MTQVVGCGFAKRRLGGKEKKVVGAGGISGGGRVNKFAHGEPTVGKEGEKIMRMKKQNRKERHGGGG